MKKYNSCLYDCVDRALKDCNNHQERNVINIYPTGWREEVCVVYYTRTDALKQEWKPSDEQIEALRIAKEYPNSERRAILETLYKDLEQLKAL